MGAGEVSGCLGDGVCTNPRCSRHGIEAGDGGLREALEKLCEDHEAETAEGGFADIDTLWPSQIREVLAAHPAAPAVPQPVTRKKLTRMLSDVIGQWDDLPEATRNRRAAAIVREIQPFLVPQPAERTRHAVWLAVYDAATQQGLQPSGVADKATEAVLALSPQPAGEAIARAIEDAADERADAAGMPAEGYYAAARIARKSAVSQPVDREALAEALYMHDNRNALIQAHWSKAMKLSRQQYLQRADAVLALLGGSAGEQVEP